MAKPTPPGNAVTTTFQIGTYNPLNENANSDGFTLSVDLDDTSSTWIMPNSLKVPAPEKTWVESGNIRSPGVAVVRWQYKNRTVDLSISIRGSNYAALQTTVAAIKAAVENPPYTIRFAWPGASQYSYFDVVKCTHNLPSDPILWLNKALPHYELHFECMPGIRGDRLTLQNLAVNPGFEAPAGGGTAQTMPVVFNDSFATVNAYALQAGSAPTVTTNVMTIPAAARVGFGSPAWGAMQNWQVRWQWITGLTADFYVHYTDANNYLLVQALGTGVNLIQTVGGTTHTLTSLSATLTTSNFYWFQVVQFPTVSGNAPMIQVKLFNDSAGAIGTQVGTTLGPVATFDAVTALVGRPQIQAVGAALAVGGAFSNVHTWTLFGPGNWTFASAGTGLGSFAWDGTRGELGMAGNGVAGTNTTNLGPVTSFGALRLDLPPAGNVNMQVRGGDPTSGATVKQTASPVSAPLDVLGVSWQVKSTGLQSTCSQFLFFNEYDSSGNFLRTGANLGVVTGNQASWTKQSTTYTTGANCAYVIAMPSAFDAGATSANGTIWFDNIQVWDQTTTGQTSMSYCELRFPNSPAQLVVSGLLGDMPAPAFLAFGSYLASWAPGAPNIKFAIGRQQVFQSNASPTAVLCGPARYLGTPTPTLDTASFNGFYQIGAIVGGSAEFDGGAFVTQQSLLGSYHLFSRAQSTQATIANVTVTAGSYNQHGPNRIGSYAVESTQYSPFAAANTWSVVDTGQMVVPSSPYGGITGVPSDPGTQSYPRILWRDPTGGGSNTWGNWWEGLPIDGAYLSVIFNNPSNSGWTVTTAWVWGFSDPLLADTGPLGAGATWRYVLGGTASEPPTNAIGGPVNLSAATVFPGISPGADQWLTLDPTNLGQNSSGVNLLCGHMTDASATVLALATELQYSPRSIWPR